jgi:hypothetical protein
VTAWLHPLLAPAAGPPLDPSPDRARSLLRHELLRPEYHDRNLLQQVLDWLQRIIDSGFQAASQASPLSTLGAIVVFLLLLVLLGWLLSRARGSARATTPERAVLTEERLTAAQRRERAESALAAGRAEEALVEGFRALTTRQIERGRIDDVPGATAHEVADSLGTTYPHQRARVADSANLFDQVLYGDRPATRDQATQVLSLDDELAAVR